MLFFYTLNKYQVIFLSLFKSVLYRFEGVSYWLWDQILCWWCPSKPYHRTQISFACTLHNQRIFEISEICSVSIQTTCLYTLGLLLFVLKTSVLEFFVWNPVKIHQPIGGQVCGLRLVVLSVLAWRLGVSRRGVYSSQPGRLFIDHYNSLMQYILICITRLHHLL